MHVSIFSYRLPDINHNACLWKCPLWARCNCRQWHLDLLLGGKAALLLIKVDLGKLWHIFYHLFNVSEKRSFKDLVNQYRRVLELLYWYQLLNWLLRSISTSELYSTYPFRGIICYICDFLNPWENVVSLLYGWPSP